MKILLRIYIFIYYLFREHTQVGGAGGERLTGRLYSACRLGKGIDFMTPISQSERRFLYRETKS